MQQNRSDILVLFWQKCQILKSFIFVDLSSELMASAGKVLRRFRCHGEKFIIVENMHDLPYVQKVGPEILTSMTSACSQVRKVFPKDKPIGVQVLAGANKGALAVALAAELDFIRAEGFVFGHVADEGWMDAQAGELLRYRNNIGVNHIKIFTDIKVIKNYNFIS